MNLAAITPTLRRLRHLAGWSLFATSLGLLALTHFTYPGQPDIVLLKNI